MVGITRSNWHFCFEVLLTFPIWGCEWSHILKQKVPKQSKAKPCDVLCSTWGEHNQTKWNMLVLDFPTHSLTHLPSVLPTSALSSQWAHQKSQIVPSMATWWIISLSIYVVCSHVLPSSCDWVTPCVSWHKQTPRLTCSGLEWLSKFLTRRWPPWKLPAHPQQALVFVNMYVYQLRSQT